ncbi:hypothetical protein PIB30_040754 [Stylosanthes scabra]|uniref:Peptidase S54 rhomboid domain-containing protein n=1 Tax=Stylosanthes scabra TaxID=79078 RepID=A0ABU6XD49_9FABA|nr:hypothetical protein [Stylosanthes scabra]
MQSFLNKLVKNHPHRRHHHHHLSATLRQPQQLVHVRNRITPPIHHSHFLTQIRGFLSNRNHHHLLHFRSKLPKPQFHRRSLSSRSQSPHLDHGWRSWFNRITANDMVHGLIIANVAVFYLWRIADKNFMNNNFAIGRIFGAEYLLKLYLAGAVVGSIFYLLHQAYKSQTSKDLESVNHSRNMASIVLDIQVINLNLAMTIKGASAAVNAILLLYVFLCPHATIFFDIVLPLPAYVVGAFYIGSDMYHMFKEDSKRPASANLGGAVVAAIAWARIRKHI